MEKKKKRRQITEKGCKVQKIRENPYSVTYFVFDRIMYWTDWGRNMSGFELIGGPSKPRLNNSP